MINYVAIRLAESAASRFTIVISAGLRQIRGRTNPLEAGHHVRTHLQADEDRHAIRPGENERVALGL